MRRNAVRQGGSILLGLAILVSAGPAWAYDYDFDGPIRKLGRGLANVGFGMWEVPIKVLETRAIDGGVAASTLGVVSGFLAAVQRTTIGLFEVVTFPFPQPNGTYEPLVEPEFIPLSN